MNVTQCDQCGSLTQSRTEATQVIEPSRFVMQEDAPAYGVVEPEKRLDFCSWQCLVDHYAAKIGWSRISTSDLINDR